MATIRIVVCGDDYVGKTLMVLLLATGTAPAHQRYMPPVTILRDDFPDASDLGNDFPEKTTIIDTALGLGSLHKELKQADVVCLVYSDHYLYERILLHWMPMLRLLGVNLPVVVCANKLDLLTPQQTKGQNKDEFIPLINEFKEIEACIRCSASTNYNIVEAFYMCQRAITHPLAPLFDAKEGVLKPAAAQALKRIFFLCDKDQDGLLNFAEFAEFHRKCFGAPLNRDAFQKVMALLDKVVQQNDGMTEDGFMVLNKMYVERGRHETIWGILRAFHYTNSLLLQDRFLYPRLDVNPHLSVELLPEGYRFLVDLFLKFDRDNDGGLNQHELDQLFTPTPGIPKLWTDLNFPRLIVCNDEGHVTLQGWLAQWNLTTFREYRTSLEYFAYLGYEGLVRALKVTKPRKRRQRHGHFYRQAVADRNIFNCFLLGAPRLGKTLLMELFLHDLYLETYLPTFSPRICVKDIELRGGKQCYLILEEFGHQVDQAVLENRLRLDTCDVLCLCYDSLDPELFQYLVDLRQKYAAQLNELPTVFVALKADLDKQQQRADIQPELYTRDLHVPLPLHVLLAWPGLLHELLIQVVDAAKNPAPATPGIEDDTDDLNHENMIHLMMAGSALTVMALVSIWIWRGSRQGR